MDIRFWGTRGSLAKPGPITLRHGGNTSCVEVRGDDGTLIVLDCGTGAHGLGQALLSAGPRCDAEGEFAIGEMRVTTQYLNHPALSLGYRLQSGGNAARRMLGTSARAAASRSAERTDGV